MQAACKGGAVWREGTATVAKQAQLTTTSLLLPNVCPSRSPAQPPPHTLTCCPRRMGTVTSSTSTYAGSMDQGSGAWIWIGGSTLDLH